MGMCAPCQRPKSTLEDTMVDSQSFPTWRSDSSSSSSGSSEAQGRKDSLWLSKFDDSLFQAARKETWMYSEEHWSGEKSIQTKLLDITLPCGTPRDFFDLFFSDYAKWSILDAEMKVGVVDGFMEAWTAERRRRVLTTSPTNLPFGAKYTPIHMQHGYRFVKEEAEQKRGDSSRPLERFEFVRESYAPEVMCGDTWFLRQIWIVTAVPGSAQECRVQIFADVAFYKRVPGIGACISRTAIERSKQTIEAWVAGANDLLSPGKVEISSESDASPEELKKTACSRHGWPSPGKASGAKEDGIQASSSRRAQEVVEVCMVVFLLAAGALRMAFHGTSYEMPDSAVEWAYFGGALLFLTYPAALFIWTNQQAKSCAEGAGGDAVQIAADADLAY
eukprot:TRINITY_DN36522_c0_g2_i1.p1 TRINITY_DN36522_c0_g2~~TRINITY_DN36522_c0_g2_i1.p1  ORF type:complete len:390 (-),score=79.18 TRINITY_DN36522_c0_g2_i1:146-1315(-)